MKKEVIYAKALSMLNDHADYESITLYEVAKKCGIGKSTIYEYFKSKDELIFNSVIYYLNHTIRFFSTDFKITTFKTSIRTFVKVLIITMKANYWLVMPWTFLYNYAPYFSEEDSSTITDVLYKYREIIMNLFNLICKKGEEEGLIATTDDMSIQFAFNGLVESLAEEVDSTFDLSTEEAKVLVEDMCSCIVKQLS